MSVSIMARVARRPIVPVLAVLLTLSGAAACSGRDGDRPDSGATSSPAPGASATGALAAYYTQTLRWKECGGGFDCTSLRVPLDYDKPDGGDISLDVIRLPANDTKRRIGSLLLNPGGPGASGIDYARAATTVVGKPLRDRFDIVGFDPRGVGRSTPVKCLTDEQLDRFIALDGSPDTPAEETELDSEAARFAARCEARSGKLLPHIGTADAARDMDVLRSVLGDRRLYYLGKSYGTFLGATYAELFPHNVGRLVLDGAVDPRTEAAEATLQQAAGFDRALKAFVADCVKRPGCPLGRDVRSGLASIDDLLAGVDREPLPGDGDRVLTQALATLGIAAAMYDAEGGWPALRAALDAAFSGDGTGLLRLADFYTERREDGHYPNNQNEVIYAVNCIDRPDVRTIAQVKAEVPEFVKASKQFGELLAWGSLPCAHWPVPPVGKPHAIAAAGAEPILVVGTTRDPATPYASAVDLAKQLKSGVLLTYEGDGHTAYGSSACIDRAVERYLLKGRPPADGTRCR